MLEFLALERLPFCPIICEQNINEDSILEKSERLHLERLKYKDTL